MSYYIAPDGKKYKTQKVYCKICGKQRFVSAYQPYSSYCVKCAANQRKNCLKKENSLIKNGRKRKAKLFKCPACGIEKKVRADHKNKSGLCWTCSARKLILPMSSKSGKEHPGFKNGIALYRKTAYESYKHICKFCNSIKNIGIHHIDGNRKNNEIENLLPLCRSCHMLLHKRLDRGYSHLESIRIIRMMLSKRKKIIYPK